MLDSKGNAVDTESNSRHHYPEQLCLIQIATGTNIYIIDTITLKDIGPLQKVLEDKSILKVIHGADYDIRSIDRHCGFRIHNLYDTYIAARFRGMTEVGLSALLRDLLGVNIVKSKRCRQLIGAGDPSLVKRLTMPVRCPSHAGTAANTGKRIEVLGRTSWVAEEFARLEEVRYTATDMENAFRR